MSCDQWEKGLITLPTNEAVRVRNALKAGVTKYQEELYTLAQEFWNAIPPKAKRDRNLYGQYVSAFVYGNDPKDKWAHYPKLPHFKGLDEGDFNTRASDMDELLTGVTSARVETPYGYSTMEVTKPRRIQKADVVGLIGKTAGTKFSVQCGEPSFQVEGRKILWQVPSNNYAVDHGRDHPLARLLFKTLATVRWTRGSGGTIAGNDEDNQHSSSAPGAGANYITQVFGPPTKKPTSQQYAAY